jgi:hypothetical protein
MIVINYPVPDFTIKEEKGKELILDLLRKKWVALTPEEWVRQNFIQFLIKTHQYPASLIAVEKEIQLGELKKRFDILVYDKQLKPWMMVECKASSVAMNEKVFEQLLRYNQAVPVSYMLITNGNYTYGWQKKGIELISIDSMPLMNL